jgi:hypothetical protein
MKRPEFGFFKSFSNCLASTATSVVCPSKVGCWQLQTSKAISLFPMEDSVLTIKQGKVWATLNTGGSNRQDGYGDHFLSVDDSLLVRKGQRLVFESIKGNLPVFFDFIPV